MARRRHRKERSEAAVRKTGLSPGSVVYTGEPRTHAVQLAVLDYDRERLDDRTGLAADAVAPFIESPSVSWVSADGIHDTALVAALCERFGVHPLAIEDAVNPSARPKCEDYGETLFVVAKMASYGGIGSDGPDGLDIEQVSLVLGPAWVLSFVQDPGDVFDPVRKRIRSNTGRIRGMGPDYLLHALLDAVVDGYFEALEHLDDHVVAAEDRALSGLSKDVPRRVHELRSDLLALRRCIWPLREAVGALVRGETRMIRPGTLPFFRDLHDHLVQATDAVDACRDRLVMVLELHIASNDNRLNEVMQTLTVITSIFIPLTFIVGVYGMNFDHMPELRWRWGYFGVLGVMSAVVLGILLWFRKKRWL